MENTYQLDYGFINEFNELDIDGQLTKLMELSTLPIMSEEPNFKRISVSHFFDLNDLAPKDPRIASKVAEVFNNDLKFNFYLEASDFIDIVGQTRESHVPGFAIKNEPLIYHLYHLITGRSLKLDLNVQRRIKNGEKVLIAPVVIAFDEIIGTIDLGYDLRFEIEEEKLEIIKAFLENDPTILASKVYLSLALRGYFGDIDLKKLFNTYFNRYAQLVDETLLMEFAQPNEEGSPIWDIVENDDRDALELSWMLIYLAKHLGINHYDELVETLISKLEVYDLDSYNESYRYLANLKDRFAYITDIEE